MKIESRIFTVAFCLGLVTVSGQDLDHKFAGRYADGFGNFHITELILRDDGTFNLKTPDYIFPYTHQSYVNSGKWTSHDDHEVILNPDKVPREKEILFRQGHIENDSVTITITYKVRSFRDEALVNEVPFDFDQLTIFVNKRRKYYNLVRHTKRSVCAFSPRVKNQVIVNSTNTLVIPRMEVGRLGIMTYGFENRIWLDVSDKKANYFEIAIIQPVDEERTPRNKKIVIKGKNAYFYEQNGKVDTSWLANTLTKRSF